MKASGKSLSLLCLALALGCSRHAKNEEESGPGTAPIVEVKLDSLTSGSVEDALTATGRTEVLGKENVASPIAGKLLALKASEGAAVKPGQVVAVVRTKESESALEGAQALLRAAGSDAEKREAQRALDLAQATQSTLSLRSKQGGVVASRLVQEGDQITENQSLLLILDMNTLDFQAEVPLSGIEHIRVGQPATVSLQGLPGSVFSAQVQAILPQIQTSSQTLSIRLRFTGTTGGSARGFLKADMAGEARIVLSARAKSLLAPKAALLRSDEDGSYSLVVMGPDSLARIIKVRPGSPQGERVEISGEGLAPGALVVTQGQHGLTDSTKVKPVP